MNVSAEDVLVLRSWVEQHPYLPQYKDDYFLRCVLVGAKGSLQRAKIKFENFHRSMQDFRDIYHAEDLLYTESSINFNKNIAIYLFPKKTAEGHQVLGVKFLTPETEHFTASLHIQRLVFAAMVNIWDQNYGNGDLVYIVDGENARLGLMKTATVRAISAFIAIFSSSTLHKIKAAHLIQLPSFAQPLANFCMKGMSEKMQNRCHFHTSFEALHSFFRKEDLPQDYGGTAPSVAVMYETYLERVKFHHDKAQIEAKSRAEEIEKRPKSELPCMADTFRKLEID